MQEAIATVIDEELDAQLHQCRFYSLMVDESTDVTTTQTLIVYIRFVNKEGKVTSQFFELAKLDGANAEAILQTLLEARHLPVEKLFGIATDGASVMVGSCSGITTRIKRKYPFVFSVHCIAHRLALASGQAADNVPYLKRYQQYINTIYKYYHYSPKHSNTLEHLQAVLDCAERKFQHLFHTRWLSFDGAVQAVLNNLEPLISALISDSSTDPTAKGILVFITTFLFLATTHLLADILPLLARLSKSFQRQCMDFSTVNDCLQATIRGMQGFKNSPGPRLTQFLSGIPGTQGEFFYFKDQRITDSSQQRDQFKTIKDTFIDKLVKNLNSRFPDSNLLSTFAIFDPQRLPSEGDLATYGDTELDVPCSHYGTPKESEDRIEIPPVIDIDQTKNEWVVFKQFISQNYRSCSLQTLSERLCQSEAAMSQYPNMRVLITLASIGDASVECRL